ncbi:MAG: YqaJ viral recombinase family protein [Smithella sp.]|jgi:putative phage-type endonuclease
MNHAELVARQRGIGGSEASAALGLSRYKSPFQLYLEKTGEIIDESDSPVMARGRRFEPVLREMYSELTGRNVELAPTIQSEIVPFMFVSPDGLAEGNRYLEIKTARNRHEFGEPGTDEIPQEYLLQCQHGLFVTRLLVADVFVAFSLDNIELYEVHADKELQEMIVAGETDFWRHVETKTPPELTTYEDVVTRYNRSSGKAITVTPEIEESIEHLRFIKSHSKPQEEDEKTTKSLIMKFMGEHDTLLDSEGNTILTWRETKPSQAFDDKKFKEAHPNLWEQFLKPPKTQRRFLLK